MLRCEELEQGREELREATEERMEAQLSLKAKKNDRRIALAVYDKQLDTLDEQVKLGDTRPFMGRVERAVRYLWSEESTGEAIPRPLKSALPDLGDSFVGTLSWPAFPDHRQKVITNQRME